MFKSILAAVAVVMTMGTAVTAGPWLDGDPGSAGLVEAYLQNEGANKAHLGNDAEVREAAEEVAAKERHLTVNTHVGADTYSELVSYSFRSGYNQAQEVGLGQFPYYYVSDGVKFVSDGLYGEYVTAKSVLLDFFAARADNLNRIQQFHLDNNSIYQSLGATNWD